MKFVGLRALAPSGRPLAESPPALEEVKRSVLRILDENMLCAIATVSSAGAAHVNAAFYAYDEDLRIYFLSHPDATHSRNVATNSTCAIAVFSTAQEWTGPDRGLQLFGTCRVALNPGERGRAEEAYGGRFPAYAMTRPSAREVQYELYEFETLRFKLLDEQEFGDAVFLVASVDVT